MIFEIHAEKSADDKKVFYYDNETNTLRAEDGFVFEYSDIPKDTRSPVVPYSKDAPFKKSKKVTLLKIQLGLSCNYTCDYCSQKFVERAPETNKKDIDDFMAKLDNLEFDEADGLKVEFWGGEPFVYWKTMKPLAEAIREKFSHWKNEPKFSVITNGSILTREICMWLYYMGFSVAISHDGPGQHVRGPDPFDDPLQKKIILDFYRIMKKNKRISFNSMINARNQSRKAIRDWFIEMTGDPDVQIGEGGIVDAYDADGAANSLNTLQEHFDYRKQAFADFYTEGKKIAFPLQLNRIDNFTKAVLSHSNAKYLGQKCGMDGPTTLAIDLRGNVITCQNVSAVETSMNGESHLAGNITDIESVEVKTATHWQNRAGCASCPVLHICQGSCMFLAGDYWEVSCNNAYSDTVPYFALTIYNITGYIPTLIKADHLPPERQDIWGTKFEHKETPKKKVIPIKVIAEKITTIDDIEVYSKSKVETL